MQIEMLIGDRDAVQGVIIFTFFLFVANYFLTDCFFVYSKN